MTLKEFEAPYKDKQLLVSAYDLIDLLMKQHIEKAHAIIIVDELINHHKVVLRKLNIPELLFRQIHIRKTKGKPDIHILMPRKDYCLLKTLVKGLREYEFFTVSMNKSCGRLANFNDRVEKVRV